MPIGIVIPADPATAPFEKSFADLSDYQKAVGGWVQPIQLEAAKLTLFANEDGKPRGLAFNRRATALWWLLDRMAREHDELVGDIVLVGATNGPAAATDIPCELVHVILYAPLLRAEIRLADRLGWHRTELGFEDYFNAVVHALLYFRSVDDATDIRVVEE